MDTLRISVYFTASISLFILLSNTHEHSTDMLLFIAYFLYVNLMLFLVFIIFLKLFAS